MSPYGSSASAANVYTSTSSAQTTFNTNNNYMRQITGGRIPGGPIEKTNMMSSENPFRDPARPYEQMSSPRKVTSVVSPPKASSGISKSLNLSDENPFFAIYGNYRYPSQVDPAKRITNQANPTRSTENKSLNLSDDNPFFATYGRYHYPSQTDSPKRYTDVPRSNGPLIPTNDLSDANPFYNNNNNNNNNNNKNSNYNNNPYRPSLIREYSTNGISGGLSPFSSSIADWTRNNPAPLSYRPIQIRRPSSDFHGQKDSTLNRSSYVPPVSATRSERQPATLSSPSSVPHPQYQFQKANSSAPLDKTSLNMSPDNPFAEAYGRYYYPSAEEIKLNKRVSNERFVRPLVQQSATTVRKIHETYAGDYQETEKKDTATNNKGISNFSRFDIDI